MKQGRINFSGVGLKGQVRFEEEQSIYGTPRTPGSRPERSTD